MNKKLVCARILQVEGALILIVAAIHLLVIPIIRRGLAATLTPHDFSFVWSPFLLNHAAVGILLISIALSTFYCASGVLAGQRWALRVGITNALAVLALPVLLATVMDRHYFHALPFLLATILITFVAVSMIWPLLWVRAELR